ncbi:MAG TPA: AzlD domain-containing protein [Jatrophihabitantaceae bacterium]|jgi:branched-subunit amino acid transport protein
MVGLAPILVLAAACWLVRVMFIVFVPAERLPGRVTAALGHVAPAVLAAHVSLELAGLVPAGAPAAGLASLCCIAAIAAVAYRRPSLTVSAGLGIASVLLIDLVLVR